MKIPLYEGPLPTITTEQMIEVDRLMMEEYQISLVQMMENAGRGLAMVAKKMLLEEGEMKNKKVVVLAGTGGNGGGAMVAARRLHSWGVNVSVVTTRPKNQLAPIPQQQYQILEQMKIPLLEADDLLLLKEEEVDLVLDGIIGYSLSGDPRGNARLMIAWANAQKAPILALDTPSGVDLTTGQIHNPCIRARATLTLALPKQGLYVPEVRAKRGALYLGDISVPPALYCSADLLLEVPPIFAAADVLLID